MPKPLAAFDSEGWVGILANATKTGGAQSIFMRSSFNAQMATAARKAVCAAFALSLGLAAAAPAHAVDFSFNFTDPNYVISTNNKQTSSVADSQVGGSNPPSFSSATFTRTVSSTKSLSLQVSAWSIDTAPTTDKTYDAVMKFWSGGIGVLNDKEVAQTGGETSSSPDHAIDNDNNNVDFLVLQFSKPVSLKSITLGWISNDSDVTIGWGDSPGAWNLLPVLNNVAIDPNVAGGLDALIGAQKTFAGTASSSTTDPRLTPNGGLSDFWIISAANPNVDEDARANKTQYLSDFMKLSAIVVSEYPPLPEPGTWMTMILGFGALGGMMRRRKFAITYNKLAA